MKNLDKRVLLVGGGHAHLFVLEALIEGRLQAVEVVLISPSRLQYYSGMLPGVIAGHYRVEQCRIDLLALAQRAGIRFLERRVVALDADKRQVLLDDGERIAYDLISLDIGSETDHSAFEHYRGALFSVKPLERFYANWQAFGETAQRRGGARLAVVGGGAAGVELAMAAGYAMERAGVPIRICLIASEQGVLPGFAPSVRWRVLKELQRRGIGLHIGLARGRGTALELVDGEEVRVDALILASGAAAPAWLADSGLALDDSGFVLVDRYHRSCSHSDLFAVGDIAARPGTPLMRSGVHSVRAGPVLARNLEAVLTEGRLQPFHPRRFVLYLLSCGRRYAVAGWGPLALSGDWVWRWKDRIDRRFIARFDYTHTEITEE